MLNPAQIVDLVGDHLYPSFTKEHERLEQIDLWYRWQHEDVTIPRRATEELRSLLQLSRTPWLGLVVTNVAQSMFVDGYRAPEAEANTYGPWRLWQANDLDGRQTAIIRAMLAYGQSYGTALPGEDTFGAPTVAMRGVSPRKMLAFYNDPAEDDWPVYALRVDVNGGATTMRLYDAEKVHYLGFETSPTAAAKLVYLEERAHDIGVCPVVRFTNQLDLDGRTAGEVEPFIPLAKRIDKTTYDRLLAQHFNSWTVRTVSGMAEPDAEEEANRAKLRLRQDDILIAEDADTKFGTLPGTQLEGFIRAHESDIKTLAAATQTPVHALTGDLINLNAEALAAARASLDAKVAERQKSSGKSFDQWLRLGSLVEGDVDAARDVMAHVTWADTSIRSLAVAADALLKFQALGVPAEALWQMIPGVSKTDVQEWVRIVSEGDALSNLTDLLERQMAPPPPVDAAAA